MNQFLFLSKKWKTLLVGNLKSIDFFRCCCWSQFIELKQKKKINSNNNNNNNDFHCKHIIIDQGKKRKHENWSSYPQKHNISCLSVYVYNSYNTLYEIFLLMIMKMIDDGINNQNLLARCLDKRMAGNKNKHSIMEW